MSFNTAESVRTALDNADLAVRQAVEDGNIVEVMVAIRRDIRKIFAAQRTKVFPAEFKADRFLFTCCKLYGIARKDNNFDEKHLESQREALAAFNRQREGPQQGSAPLSVPGMLEAGPPPVPNTTTPTMPAPLQTTPVPTMVPSEKQTVPPETVAPQGAPAPIMQKASSQTTTVAPPSVSTPLPTTTTGMAKAKAAPKVKPSKKRAAQREPQAAPTRTAPIHLSTRTKVAERSRQLRPPTEEMARLSVGDVIVSRPVRRFRSLEEEEEDDEGPGLKRKREAEGEEEEEEEVEDDDEEKEAKKSKKRKGPTKRVGDKANRRVAKRTGQFFDPPCERCERTGRGMTCERQQGSKACCHCYTRKQRCVWSPKGMGKDEESSEGEETAPPKRVPSAISHERKAHRKDAKRQRREDDGEKSAPHMTESAGPSQGKGKAKATDADFARWDAEGSAVPTIDEERAADKARIAQLERRLEAMEQYLWTHKGVDEQLKWAKRSLEWFDGRGDEQDERLDALSLRLDEQDEQADALSLRLNGLEDYFGMPIGDWQGIGLYDGQDISVVHRMRSPRSRKERDAQLLAAYPMTERERQCREDDEASEDELSEDETAPRAGNRVDDEASEDELSEDEMAPTAGNRVDADSTAAVPSAPPPTPSRSPSAQAGSQSTVPTAGDQIYANSTPAVPSAPPHTPHKSPVVNIIAATPQSSQDAPQVQTTTNMPAPCPHLPTIDGAASASPVADVDIPPPPPASMVMPPPSNWDPKPPPHWEEVTLPASTLLTVPNPDAMTPNLPRRSRSRSPSPGPTRRSPRFQSPLPPPPPTAPAAQCTDGESGDSMDVDNSA